MQDYMEDRIMRLAYFTIETKSTVRETATKFKVSKTTVHKDLQERLPTVNKQLYDAVNAILMFNKSERHIRGGLATRNKYRNNLTE